MKNIKKITSIIVLCFGFIHTTMAQNNPVNTLDFTGIEYFLAFEDSDNKAKVIEFLPKGENLDDFKSMVSYWEQKTITEDKIEGYLNYLAQDTQEPVLSTTIAATKDEAKNEYYLEKLITSGNITEYVMYRFIVKDGHLAYYLFSERVYEKPSLDWFKSLENDKVARFKAINELEI